MTVQKILEILDYDIFNACVQKIHKWFVSRIPWNIWLHKTKIHTTLKKNKQIWLPDMCMFIRAFMYNCLRAAEWERSERPDRLFKLCSHWDWGQVSWHISAVQHTWCRL